MTVLFLVCILLLSVTSVQQSLDVGQNLKLRAQYEKVIAEKVKVLQLEDKDDSNSTDQDFRYTDVIQNDGLEESDHGKEEEEKEEEGVDLVDEELELRDRDMMMLDATGGENDADSFFGSLRMEAHKKSLGCKYKCDRRCYNPHQQQCCKKKIVRRPWRCCPHSCGNVCFDSKTKQCCKGKVTLKSQNCAGCANRCGRRCFNPRHHRCCRGNVTPKNFKVCGRRCFNPRHQSCCRGNVTPKNFKVCGRRCFNPRHHRCCRGNVTPKNFQVCGRRCFNPRHHRCCRGNVTPKNFQVCGRRCFNPRHHRCCRGNVTPKNFQVCGRRCFNPRHYKCCRSRVVSRRVSCSSCHRCGGVCINPRLYRCCHQRSIRRHIPCISGHGHPLRITQGLIARRVGCFRDTWNRAIPSLETKSYILIGNYEKRPFAIEKCALAAAKLGWSVFAVQDQGWCASSPIAGRTFSKYGRSNTCRNGKGGPWGNDVYVLLGKAGQRTTSGDICVFPFIYKGKLYNGCTRVNHNRPWCAITPNYDVDKLWGNC